MPFLRAQKNHARGATQAARGLPVQPPANPAPRPQPPGAAVQPVLVRLQELESWTL